MLEVLALLLLGLVAGGFAATLGVGGGVIFVPFLVFVFEFAQLDAQGTSLAIIVPTAIIGAIGHARAGRIHWKVFGVVAAVGVFGAAAGALLAQSADGDTLRTVFAVVLGLLAVRMGLRTFSLWRASRTVDTR
ncbi:MAG: TSUP family transporter [Acidimicrobiia bacterium]